MSKIAKIVIFSQIFTFSKNRFWGVQKVDLIFGQKTPYFVPIPREMAFIRRSAEKRDKFTLKRFSARSRKWRYYSSAQGGIFGVFAKTPKNRPNRKKFAAHQQTSAPPSSFSLMLNFGLNIPPIFQIRTFYLLAPVNIFVKNVLHVAKYVTTTFTKTCIVKPIPFLHAYMQFITSYISAPT